MQFSTSPRQTYGYYYSSTLEWKRVEPDKAIDYKRKRTSVQAEFPAGMAIALLLYENQRTLSRERGSRIPSIIRGINLQRFDQLEPGMVTERHKRTRDKAAASCETQRFLPSSIFPPCNGTDEWKPRGSSIFNSSLSGLRIRATSNSNNAIR